MSTVDKDVIDEILDEVGERDHLHMGFNPTFDVGPPHPRADKATVLELASWHWAKCAYHTVAMARFIRLLSTQIDDFENRVAHARFKVPSWVKQAMRLPPFSTASEGEWWAVAAAAFIEGFVSLSHLPTLRALCNPSPPDSDLALKRMKPAFYALADVMGSEFENHLETEYLASRPRDSWFEKLMEKLLQFIFGEADPDELAERDRAMIPRMSYLLIMQQSLGRVILSEKLGWQKPATNNDPATDEELFRAAFLGPRQRKV